MATHEVTIGDAKVELHRFKGFKATEMLTLLGLIYDEVPELEQRMDASVRKYHAENTVKVPRAYYEAHYPDEAARISAEAWEKAGDVIEVPGPDPSIWRIVLGQLSYVISMARRRSFDLLALAICPNSELADLDIDDEVDHLYGKDGVLAPYRKKLMHDAEGQQLLALAGAVVELIKDQFGGDVGGGLGKLKPLADLLGALLGVEPDEEEPAPRKTAARSSSSKSARRSRGGAAKRSSTKSRGGKSAASVGS